jgi:hypothetical protein
MTKHEFEQWLDTNYEALTKRVGRGERGWALEALQYVVARLLEDPAPLAAVHLRDGLDGWLVARLRGALRNQRKATNATRRMTEKLGDTLAVLGADAYKDPTRDRRAARNQRHRPGPVGEAGLWVASGASTETVWCRGTPALTLLGPGGYRLPTRREALWGL